MTVFEVSNETLKEFYVCASAASLDELMREHCDRPPAMIAHWKKNQGVFYNEIETLPDAETPAFMRKYAAVLERTGWKVYCAL